MEGGGGAGGDNICIMQNFTMAMGSYQIPSDCLNQLEARVEARVPRLSIGQTYLPLVYPIDPSLARGLFQAYPHSFCLN